MESGTEDSRGRSARSRRRSTTVKAGIGRCVSLRPARTSTSSSRPAFPSSRLSILRDWFATQLVAEGSDDHRLAGGRPRGRCDRRPCSSSLAYAAMRTAWGFLSAYRDPRDRRRRTTASGRRCQRWSRSLQWPRAQRPERAFGGRGEDGHSGACDALFHARWERRSERRRPWRRRRRRRLGTRIRRFDEFPTPAARDGSARPAASRGNRTAILGSTGGNGANGSRTAYRGGVGGWRPSVLPGGAALRAEQRGTGIAERNGNGGRRRWGRRLADSLLPRRLGQTRRRRCAAAAKAGAAASGASRRWRFLWRLSPERDPRRRGSSITTRTEPPAVQVGKAGSAETAATLVTAAWACLSEVGRGATEAGA